MTTTVEVSGSKNGFPFGPLSLCIDELAGEAERAAVLDALLAQTDTDGIDSVLRPSQHEGHSAADCAAQRGFTALTYRHRSGDIVKIV